MKEDNILNNLFQPNFLNLRNKQQNLNCMKKQEKREFKKLHSFLRQIKKLEGILYNYR